jgi:hypothetical protein
MGSGARCYVVPFLALVLAAAALEAQDIASGEQAAGTMLPVVDPLVDVPQGPSIWFQADWLWTPHAGMWGDSRNFINGPDAASFSNLPDVTAENGYRLSGGVRVGNWYVEAAYSHYGDWQSSLNENVNGVAFNAAASAGNWAGENSINASTYFAPIFNAASQTAPVNTAGDQSGLGPSTAFATDARPALMAFSESTFYMLEANIKSADYLLPLGEGGLRLGAGYVNANLTNDSWVALTGTFRASNISGTTVSLPNSVLTSPTGGNLILYSGGGTGFTDGISNGGTGTPSQLRFTHRATTHNILNGAQCVLDWDMLQYHRLNFAMALKAGVFDNLAEGSIVETYSATNNDLSSYYRKFSDSSHHFAFLGGVGVSGRFHITDEVSFCAGYDALFLTNQALGPEQINGLSNNWYRVQTNGSAVIQSVTFGLEIGF